MHVASVEERLSITVSLLQRMVQALVRVSGSMWSPDGIDVRLHALIDLVSEAPSHLTLLQESTAFEGARIVLVRLKAYRLDICTTEDTTTIPECCQLADFIEEVKEVAKLMAANCDLDVRVE